MTKSRAALTHFWPSALLLLAISSLILLLWYPYPFWEFKEKARFALLLIIVAGLIGPLMTAFVYKKGKRGLLLDLSVIVIIQITALAWGSWALYQTRPFFMVFTVDRFEVLTMREVDPGSIANKAFLDKPVSGPILLFAQMPRDELAFRQLLKEIMFEGKPDLQFRPEFWSLYSESQSQAVKPSKPLSTLRSQRPESSAAIDQLVQKHAGDIDSLNFVPAIHRNGEFAVVLDAVSGEVVDTLVVNPWVD